MSRSKRAFNALPPGGAIILAGFLGTAAFTVQLVSLLTKFGSSLITDDAFITFRYARNLAQGNGLVFNVGERVEGATTFLWPVLLAVCERLGVGLAEGAVVMALVACYSTILLVALITDRLLDRVPDRGVFVVGASVSYAFLGALPLFVLSGMETMLLTSLLCLGFYLWLRAAKPLVIGLVFGVAGLTRPEAVLLLGLLGAVSLLADLDGKERDLRQRVRRVAWIVAGFLCLYAPYFAWRFSYYGHLFPNTYYAKFDGQVGGPVLARGFSHLRTMVRESSLEFIFALAVIGALLTRRAAMWVLVASAFGSGLYVCLVGGDFMFAFGPRQLAPAMPLLVVAAVVGIAALGAKMPLPQRATSLVLLGLFAAHGLLFSKPWSEQSLQFTSSLNKSWDEIGKWLNAYTDDDATIAVGAVGRIPFHAERYTIDLLGLTDAHIAHTKVELGAGIPGHEKSDADYVLQRDPDVFVFVRLDPQGRPTSVNWQTHGERIDARYEVTAVARWSEFSGGPWVLSDVWSPSLGQLGYMQAIYSRRQDLEQAASDTTDAPAEPGAS